MTRRVCAVLGAGLLVLAVGCAEKAPADDSVVAAGAVASEVAAAQSRLEASSGGKRILDTINAHGGLAAWYAAPTSAYYWEYANLGSEKRFKTYLVTDNQTRQVYHEIKSDGADDAAQAVVARFAWDGKEAWVQPADFSGINARFWALTPYYFQSIPFVFADPGLIFTELPPEELEGKTYDVVQVGFKSGVGDAPGDTYAVYIDPQTNRLRAIRYTVTFFGDRGATDGRKRETLFYYDNWETVDGLNVATHFRGFHVIDGVLGEAKNEAWSSDISFRVSFDSSKLKMPADGAIVPAPGS